MMGELHDRKKVMAVVYWGEDAINKVRKLAGSTNPEEADPVSIRGLTAGLPLRVSTRM